MPFINVKVAGVLTIEQKREIANEMSDTMLRVTGKPKSACYIVFFNVLLVRSSNPLICGLYALITDLVVLNSLHSWLLTLTCAVTNILEPN